MSLITDEEQQKDTTERSQSETNILYSESFRYLAQKSVDRQGNDKEKIQIDKSEGIAIGNTCITRQFT